ncbi:Ger(x)C family spore germination protein [Paenibacillus soyae]|uniref:Ger(X)C family spore germination C-terminal domain-containing protein n=1 Tax=Paenibacillus soyae TaxID=2969249 RepID=A0A9X2SDF3_9BACL|nr:Ger(x)C family spore germination C-terminal domain-containing protein [Paenibacillus soyae]MCR2807082.1 Ger(x)C family spore germination C-terminal domain-containing protein [Paenibacillus soyae]
MRAKISVFILIAVLFLASCSDQKIIERLGFTRLSAFDSVENSDDIRVTSNIPKADQKGRFILSSVARTSKEARITFSRENNRRIVSGQLRMVLFGDSLAGKGVWKHMDTFVRDSAISQKLFIAVVEGNAGALISKEYKPYPTTSDYLTRLVETNMDAGLIPKANLFTFTRDYMNDGVDPVAPLIKQDAKSVKMTGVALFQDDRYVGRIEQNKSIIFSFLHRKVTGADLSISLDDGEQIMLGNITSKRKLKVTGRSLDQMKLSVHVELHGSIQEYTGDLDLSEGANQMKLESLMSDSLKKTVTELVDMFQRKKVDPLGMGKLIRNRMGSYEEWKAIDQRKAVSEIEVEVEAVVRVKDYGLLQED